jgi:TonB family protein
MVTRLKIILALLCLFLCLGLVQEVAALQSTANIGQIILSPTRPKDSRGEAVYQGRGPTQQDQPAVSGVFVQASPIKLPDPKYPKSLKKARADADVTVEGVISESGDYIDVTVTDPVGPDPEIEKSALDAVARYKFKPATLDGKPIALLTRVVIHFRIR